MKPDQENLDQLDHLDHLEHWIDGAARSPASGAYLDNIDPKDGSVCGKVARGNGEDVQRAVAAAARCKVPGMEERAALLEAVARAMDERCDAFAAAEARDAGKPEAAARKVDVPRSADNLRFFAGALRSTSTDCNVTDDGLNYTLRQPLGVVGTITPWNFPLLLFTWKVAPAIAMGNAVVAKPSELTPTTAAMTAQLFSELGAPPGLLNVVHGLGAEVGAPLVAHPDVKAISFTGGTVTGKGIAAAAAPLLKKVSLELGGKNPSVVCADCDFEPAVKGVAGAAFYNTGQVCLCGSRLIVEEEIHDRFVEALVRAARKWQPGERIGPLISTAHRDEVEGYIALAKEDGGEVVCGGKRAGPEGGAFFEPTVITGLGASCRAAQEEIFGPVITVHPFKDEEEALALANGVIYGLAASLWTRDLARAHRMAARLESGMVWVNAWNRRDLRVPFGGMKQSGMGREGGHHAMRFFSQDRNIYIHA